MKQSNDHSDGSLTAKLLITSAFGTALTKTYPIVMTAPYGPEWGIYVWGIGAVLTASGIAAIARDVVQIATGVSRNLRALRPAKTGASAQWLSARQAYKAGLGKTAGMFLGIVDGQPLFIPSAVHSLVCAPARKGKTTASVMPALLHDIGMSRMVADMKGELAVQASGVIAHEHGHTVLILNPGQKFDLPNAGYNPMQIILDDLEHAPQDAIADARSLSLQLHPEPAGGSREPFWGNGTRKILTLGIAGLCALGEPEGANLSNLFAVLSDDSALKSLLFEALQSDVLAGELSALGKNILTSWDENTKQFESFREGAIQSLVPFGPSGRLATSVQHCDFRFRDLKAKPTTIFMVCDPSRADVFAPWVGLMVWAALKELIREDNTTPVRLILDEFTNYHLPGLPSALTALAGYGILCTMVVQELEEIARVYGREALITIMSQSDVKQFFGVSSLDSARLVSAMLGEQEVISESFGMGQSAGDAPSLSIGRARAPLLTPEQIRRLREDEQIIFVKNLPPIRALKVGYQEVQPWRDQVAPNPLHGGKAFLGKVKMRLVRGHAKATRAGRAKRERQPRPFLLPVLAALTPLSPGMPVLLLAGALLIVATYG